MRDDKLKLCALAVAAALLIPSGADAAGLGRLTMLSHLGQPLNAEVELLSVQKNETITGRLASPEVYQQAGAQYNNALTGTRVTLETRRGQQYLKVTTPRPVTEPFIELLIEINSEHGRVLRQYTALLDPPGYGSAAAEIPPPAVAAAPMSQAPVPAATPAPYEAGAAAAARAPSAPRAGAARAPAQAGARQYGPIKRGETLGGIARSVKPDGVSLEQTLVGLYRHNPDAFIRNNMNLVKSGRILTVPEATELDATAQREAVREVRMHVADFNAYRNRLADRAVAARGQGDVTSGRIGSRVADSAGGEGPRDTVRLSPGDAKSKGAASDAERVRALEEEAVARDKALAEANARIAQLERIIKDSQRAAELKGGAAPAKGAEKAAPVPRDAVVAPLAGEPPAKAPEPAPKGAPADALKAAPAPADMAKAPEAAPGAAAPGVAAPAPAEPPKGALKEQVATAKPKPKPVAEPPPPEPSIVDELLNEPLYLALAGGVVVLGGVGLIMARRRRAAKAAGEDGVVKIAPSLGAGTPAESPAGAASAKAAAASGTGPAPFEPAPAARPAAVSKPPAAAATTDDNDLDFNVATARTNPLAPPPSTPKAEAPPVEPRPAPKPPESARAPEPPRAPEAPRAPEPAPAATRPPVVEPPRAAAPPTRTAEPPSSAPGPKPDNLMDFSLDSADLTPAARKDERKPVADDSNVMDFNLEPLPPVNAPMDIDKVSTEPPQSVDFKLDLANLDLGESSKPAAGAATRDDHWYDVQQKFDLAKAYEEMGDKDGAREILQEVVREGDAEQQEQAKKLLGSLS